MDVRYSKEQKKSKLSNYGNFYFLKRCLHIAFVEWGNGRLCHGTMASPSLELHQLLLKIMTQRLKI